MSFLLDTSTFLWFVNEAGSIREETRRIIEDPDNTIHVSLVSFWEIAIKANLGRGLNLPHPFSVFIDMALDNYDFKILEITVLHIKRVNTLPHFHRDPFDRLLIAQALTESLPLISNDAAFDSYRVQRLW